MIYMHIFLCIYKFQRDVSSKKKNKENRKSKSIQDYFA